MVQLVYYYYYERRVYVVLKFIVVALQGSVVNFHKLVLSKSLYNQVL